MKRILLAIVLGLFLVSPALGIQTMTASSGSDYTLPAATSSTLGGVKPDGTSILNSSGAISVTPASIGAIKPGDTVSLGPITLPAGTAVANSQCTALNTPVSGCTGNGTGTLTGGPLVFQSGADLSTCINGNEMYDGTLRKFCVNTTKKTYLWNDLSNLSAPSAVTGILLTGFSSGAGTVAATDSILQAINKLDGNIAGKQASGSYLTPASTLDATKLSGNLPAISGASLTGLLDSQLPAPTTTVGSGSVRTTVTNNEYVICTTTCTITLKAPAAGVQVCARDDAATTGAITFAALGSGVYYEKPDHSAYGTVATGTLVSTAATYAEICLVGRDSTHYMVMNSVGTWTAN